LKTTDLKMKILFVGMVDFSQHCLKEIIDLGGRVVGVLTIEQQYAKFNSDYCDLSSLANKYDIPIIKVKNIDDEMSIKFIKDIAPDIIFVLGFSQLIPKRILDIPSKGVIGSHPAALPKQRGRHPITWTLIDGKRMSALTFFYITEEIDSGDILAQKNFSISLDDDAGTVYKKVVRLAKEILKELLPLLENNSAPRTQQDETLASYRRKRSQEDGLICWKKPNMEVYNLIRALARPYAGAHTIFSGREFKIWKAKIENKTKDDFTNTIAPGTILNKNNKGVKVKTCDGALLLTEIEDNLMNRIKTGDVLGK